MKQIENIAEITKTEYDKSWADAIATVKYLSVGKTKLIATLNYNGETYSDSYDLDVIEEEYYLELYGEKYTNNNLPSSLEVGDKIQLYEVLRNKRGKVVWTSSNEKVANVDDKGLVTAIGEGTTTITVKYTDANKTATAKYDLKITDPTKSPANPGNSSKPTNSDSSVSSATKSDPTTSPTILPKTGENATIIVIGIILTVAISMIMYKKYKNYKDIK